jgi:SulP family sulfate permease
MSPTALKRFSTKYRVILLTTFALTVLFDLTIAVEVGMVLASLAFIYQMARFTHVDRLPLERRPDAARFLRPDGSLRVAAYRISGALFFGAIHKLDELLDTRDWPDVVVLDLGKLVSIDASGLDTLRAIARELGKRGIPLVLAEPSRETFRTLRKAGFLDEIGRENVRRTFEDALAHAATLQRREPSISYT